jgi:hypothetical protein
MQILVLSKLKRKQIPLVFFFKLDLWKYIRNAFTFVNFLGQVQVLDF